MHKQSDKLAQFYRENEMPLTVDALPALKRLSYYDRAQLSEDEKGWALTPAARAFAFAAQPWAASPDARAGSAWLAWALFQGLKRDAQRGDYDEATRDARGGWRVLFGTLGGYEFARESCRSLGLQSGADAAFANIDEVVQTYDVAFERLLWAGCSRRLPRYDLDLSGATVFQAVPLDLLLVFAQALNFDVRLVEHRPRVDPAKVMRWTGRVPLGLIERSLWATLENRIGVLDARQRVKRFGETLGNDYEWVCIPRVMRRLLREGRIQAAPNEVYDA